MEKMKIVLWCTVMASGTMWLAIARLRRSASSEFDILPVRNEFLYILYATLWHSLCLSLNNPPPPCAEAYGSAQIRWPNSQHTQEGSVISFFQCISYISRHNYFFSYNLCSFVWFPQLWVRKKASELFFKLTKIWKICISFSEHLFLHEPQLFDLFNQKSKSTYTSLYQQH